jgi:rhodanese-related sulfurtransferase
MKTTPLIAILSLFILACNAQSQQVVSPAEFEKGTQSEKIQILDVRTAGEFKSGHIAKALQADRNNPQQFQDRTQHLDKSKPVYIYCLSGGRSSAAAGWLREKGFSVTELKGGINAWKAESKPLEGVGNLKPQMTTEEYNTAVNSHKIVLVDFGAEWCPPCKKMEPVLESLVKEKTDQFKLVKVDGGNDLNLMKWQKVEALPVFIVYKDGKEIWRKQGIVSKEELVAQLSK